MGRDDAQCAIETALKIAIGHLDVELSDSTNLVGDEILDSLDSSVFLLELEKASGKKISDQDVEAYGLFVVGNLKQWLAT